MAESGFRFVLTVAEKTYLKDLVRWAIAQGLTRQPGATPPQAPPQAPQSDKLDQHLGAFVTLKLHGQLRGCIGHIVGDQPLWRTVAEMARAAAFEDPRFPPLSAAESREVEVEISVLSPLARCPDPAQVEVGRHGLLVRRGQRSGLLLPQVATEWHWDRETFLRQTCAKAGMTADCWQSPETQLWWFEAEVF